MMSRMRESGSVAIRSLSRKDSIGTRIFAAFVAMGLITAALGGYGLYVLLEAGKIVVDTYDRPLMAINFARSASLTFMQMDKEVLRRNIVSPPERADIDVNLQQLTANFFEDLEIADQRSLGDGERKTIGEIRELVAQWGALREQATATGDAAALAALDTLAEKIVDRFDVLTELTAGDSFVERRKAVWAISYFKYTSIAVAVLALLLSAAITWHLSRRIVRPLAAAATVADRIAAGELQTPIPASGKDETGALLRSMQVMQDNIRRMMEGEMAERRSAESRLIDALESSPEGMLLVTADGKVALANSQVASFFPGCAAEFATGATFSAVLAAIRPLLAVSGEIDAATPVAWEAMPSTREYQLADGRWIRISRSNTHDGGFFLFLSDFTEIKRREEHFRESQRIAEEASSAKSSFLANMSHELRTPLNAIIGFSEIIASQLFGEVKNPKYVEYAGNILQSGRHLLDIISSVLDLAKSEAGKLEVRLESVDLRRIFDECATMMRDQCGRAQLKLEVPRCADALPVRGEPAKLRQIVLNLLSNAVKFTLPGGAVSLTAGPGQPGFWQIEVADTGIGMSERQIAVALAPFGQVDSSLARRYAGTGLGLPLTKSFVELHGGSMTLVSEPGLGTRVIVTLPRHLPAEDHAQQVLPVGAE
jgi:signal transduction histidine kinase/HAMP domain-containing protein